MSDEDRRVSKWGLSAVVVPLAGWAGAAIPMGVLALLCMDLVPRGLTDAAIAIVFLGYVVSLVVAALGMFTSITAAVRIQADNARVRGRVLSIVGFVLSLGLAVPSVLATLAVAGVIFLIANSGGVLHGRPARGSWKRRRVRVTGRVERWPHLSAGIAWVRCAQEEHEAVAAFERLALELDALDAPPSLVDACRRAAEQERRHARDCLALASRFLGCALSLPDLPVLRPRDIDRHELGLESWQDGMLGEGLAAAVAAEAAERVDDAEVADVLRRIAVDEAEHAELGRAIATWCGVTDAPAPAQPVFPTDPLHGGVPRAVQDEAWQALL